MSWWRATGEEDGAAPSVTTSSWSRLFAWIHFLITFGFEVLAPSPKTIFL